VWILELNDTQIELSHNGKVLYSEPGIASLAKSQPVFGNAALSTSRVSPRQSQNQYFGRMNSEPVTLEVPNIKNQADLVYQHLVHIKANVGIGDSEKLYVAVPSSSTEDQLSLLLGIAQEAKLRICALVDMSVAAACSQQLPPDCTLIDVSLHRALITRLNITKTVSSTNTIEVPETGLAPLMEGWVNAVADRFVTGTRFDPLRIAETEQQVFDRVHKLVRRQYKADAGIEIRHNENLHRIDMPLSGLAQKSQQRYEVLEQNLGQPTVLLLTHRVIQLPGLAIRLERLGHSVIALPEDAARKGIDASNDALQCDDSSVQFVSSLPSNGLLKTKTTHPYATGTHLLSGPIASAISDEFTAGDHPEAVDLGNAFRLVRRRGVQYIVANGESQVSVNGQNVEGEVQAMLGDVIVCQDHEFRIIRVARM
jgi:hypothetical protein